MIKDETVIPTVVDVIEDMEVEEVVEAPIEDIVVTVVTITAAEADVEDETILHLDLDHVLEEEIGMQRSSKQSKPP